MPTRTNDKAGILENLVATTAYVASLLLRWLFLSKVGALAHNYIILLAYETMSPRFGLEVPDVPEVGKVLTRGRCRSPETMGIVRKIYTLTPPVRKRVVENHVVWQSAVGWLRRQKQKRRGKQIPSNVYISPTYNCNLACEGCYANGHKSGELPYSEIERIVAEQEELGIFHVVVLGGEPFLRSDLWQIYAKFPRTLFNVFTNGTLVNEEVVERIASLGNIRLIISLEGFKETTDRRRGKGVYDKIMKALAACQRANIYYGVSVTVAQENFKEVTSKAFIEEMSGSGIHLISFVLYMPCGVDNGTLSPPTAEQVKKLERWGEYIQDHYPIVPVVGRNGSELVTACPAASGRIHITAIGDVEPCMFCHFAAETIAGKSITWVMDSEFFQRIRLLNSTGEPCLTPCKASGSPVLQRLFEEAGAYSTTEGG